MTTITFHRGNLLESSCDIVGHQTNCQGVMGVGIAKVIRDTWPRVFAQYKIFCVKNRQKGRFPPGGCKMVYVDEERSRIVANLFGQERYGRGKRQTDYDALQRALHFLANNDFVRKKPMSIGFPCRLGCALGGGEWDIVLGIIEEEFNDYPGRVEIWEL